MMNLPGVLYSHASTPDHIFVQWSTLHLVHVLLDHLREMTISPHWRVSWYFPTVACIFAIRPYVRKVNLCRPKYSQGLSLIFVFFVSSRAFQNPNVSVKSKSTTRKEEYSQNHWICTFRPRPMNTSCEWSSVNTIVIHIAPTMPFCSDRETRYITISTTK